MSAHTYLRNIIFPIICFLLVVIYSHDRLYAQTLLPHNYCAGAAPITVKLNPLTADSLAGQHSYQIGGINVNYVVTVDGDSTFDPLNTTGFSGKYKMDGWRKFTAPSKNVAIISSTANSIMAYTLYKGTCGNLIPIAYYVPPTIVEGSLMVIMPGGINYAFHWIVENLNPGQEYYIRYGVLTSDNLTNQAECPALVYALPDKPRKIYTTAQGGNFSSPSTWQGGIKPTPYDSIVVRDGATLTIDHSHVFGHLTIGEGGSAPARFKIGAYDIHTTYLDNVHVLPGDSMCTFHEGGYPFVFTRDLRLDGIFKSNFLGLMGHITNLAFINTKRQRVYGTGRFVRANIPGIVISNDEGLKWEIDGELWKPVFIVKGEFDHYSANITSWNYFNPSNIFSPNDGGNYNVGTGFTRKSIPIHSDSTRPFTVLTRTISYSDVLGFRNVNYDSILPYYRDHRIKGISVSKKRSGYVRTTGNVITHESSNINNPRLGQAFVREGIFQGRITDTLFGNDSYTLVQVFPAYSDFGVIASSLFPPGISGTNNRIFKGGRNGRNRYVALTKVNFLPSPPDQRFYYKLHDAPPTGAVTGNLRMLLGIHHVELASKYELHDSIKVEYFLYDYDNIIGPLENVRLAQAPTPQGPWKEISGPPIKPELMSEQRLLRSRKGVKLSEGAFFALASISNLIDARVLSVHPPGAFRFGCPGAGVVRVPMRVQNIGINALSTIVVGAKINDQVYMNLYSLTNPLTVNKIDTFWVELPQSLSGVLQAKFFTALPGDGNNNNDTINITLPYDIKSLPYIENFDTVSVITNLPHRYPIIRGYENFAGAPPSSTVQHTGFGVGFNNQGNKWIGFAGRFQQPIYLATMRLGPIGTSTYFSYLLAGTANSSVNPPTGLSPNDTLIIEASGDCGFSYKPLRKFHRNNLPVLNGLGQPPTFRFIDSLPFEPGSMIHIRFRTKGFTVPPTAAIISIDNIKVLDTLITQNQKEISNVVDEVVAYPNPASGEVQFQGAKLQTGKLIISDLQGRAVLTRMIKPNEPVSIKHLSPGIYIWKVDNNSKVYTGKLMVE